MFDISKFTSVAAQALSNNAEMHWLYQTQDSAADIQLAAANTFNNYFAEAYSLLSEGNIITVRHMSTPDDTAATKSMTSTVIDEVDYVVIHKGEQLTPNGDGPSRVVKTVVVYPLQKGQRILVRKFDNCDVFTNTDVSFQSPVCVTKLGIVRLEKIADTKTLMLTLKQHVHGGPQLGTVSMTAANSATAGSFNETTLAGNSKCIDTSFNIEGNGDGTFGVHPFIVYLVAESDAGAHVDYLTFNPYVADANANATVSVLAPVGGVIKSMTVATSANSAGGCTYTLKIGGVNVTDGVATIANGANSATANPTALNIVAPGNVISVDYTALGAAGSASILIALEH